MQWGLAFQNKKLHAPANRERNVGNHRTTNLSDSDHIKACYLNARSIRNKFLYFEEEAGTDKFDIIAITDSWLNTKDRDFLEENNLPGYYKFIWEIEKLVVGGVIFYIKNSLHPCAIQTENSTM